MPVINQDSRSASDVTPGELKVTTLATSNSRFASTPAVTGTSIYPVDIDLKCIASGLSTRALDPSIDQWLGKLLWAYKLTGRRIQTTLAGQVVAGQTLFLIADTSGVSVGDRLTIGVDDEDLHVTDVYHEFSAVTVAPAISTTYPPGTVVSIDPGMDGRWSHTLWWDAGSGSAVPGRYRGISEILAGADAGSTEIRITSVEPFAIGTYFQAHSISGTETYGAAYRVNRIRSGDELGADYSIIEFSPSLKHGVSEGDPVSVFISIPPVGQGAKIGQSGVMVSLVTHAGDISDETESPVSEGDMIRISYPGMILKKNDQRRATATDSASISTYGLKKRKRKNPNRFMDYQLSLMDVSRSVRRNATPKLWLELSGVCHHLPVDQQILLRLEPWDIVAVTDFELLADRSGYTASFKVSKVSYNTLTGLTDLRLEELDSSEPDSRFSEQNDAPGIGTVSAVGLNGAISLAWVPPKDSDYDGGEIRYSTTEFPRLVTDGTSLTIFSKTAFDTKHNSLTNGVTYYYSIFFEDTGSKYSRRIEVSAIPLAAILDVTSLTAAADEDEQVTLEWTDPTGLNLIGHVIRYRTDGTNPTGPTDGTSAGVAPPGVQQFIHTGLDNGRKYNYGVFCTDPEGNVSSGVFASATPDFDPANYVSVSARWRTHDLIGSVSDGGSIETLADASGNGHTLTKFHDGYRPVLDASDSGYNDLPVMVFTSDCLRAAAFDIHSNDDGMMMFVVGEIGTTASSQCFIARYNTGAKIFYVRGKYWVWYGDVSGSPYTLCNVEAAMTINTPQLFDGVWYPEIISANADGISDVWVDDAYADDDDADSVAQIPTGGSEEICIGATNYTGNPLQGRIAEIILCNAYDEGARQIIRNKLRKKYQPNGMNPLPDEAGGAFTSAFSREFSRAYSEFSTAFSGAFKGQE
jgi:hypothetical protein